LSINKNVQNVMITPMSYPQNATGSNISGGPGMSTGASQGS